MLPWAARAAGHHSTPVRSRIRSTLLPCWDLTAGVAVSWCSYLSSVLRRASASPFLSNPSCGCPGRELRRSDAQQCAVALAVMLAWLGEFATGSGWRPTQLDRLARQRQQSDG